MKRIPNATCAECGDKDVPCVRWFNVEEMLCAECIRIAWIILAHAEKDAAKDDVPSPEGERK